MLRFIDDHGGAWSVYHPRPGTTESQALKLCRSLERRGLLERHAQEPAGTGDRWTITEEGRLTLLRLRVRHNMAGGRLI